LFLTLSNSVQNDRIDPVGIRMVLEIEKRRELRMGYPRKRDGDIPVRG